MEIISMEGQVGIGYRVRNLRLIDGQAIHHFAVDLQDFFGYEIIPEELTQEEEESVILVVDAYHNSPPIRDWGGIAYSYVVFPSGRAYWFGPLTQQRAGVGYHNHHLVSWCFAGNFQTRRPTVAALDTGVIIGKRINGLLGLTRVAVKGHCQWADPRLPTACPGVTYPHWLPDLADRINAREEEPMPVDIGELLKDEFRQYGELRYTERTTMLNLKGLQEETQAAQLSAIAALRHCGYEDVAPELICWKELKAACQREKTALDAQIARCDLWGRSD